MAVRDAWATKCQVKGISVCRFILSEDEITPLVEEEMQEHRDIVLMRGQTTYKSILLKSIFIFEYAVKHYDARFILKTDDDAFVNTPAMVHQLRMLCESPDCRREHLYMGLQCRRGEVILSPGHKWNNDVYYNHTGLKTYVNYMLGGGYILSADAAAALVAIADTVRLKFTPIEDATIGLWLTGMDLRHIDHPKCDIPGCSALAAIGDKCLP
jgi:galactosylxylosylprotein 3-beta-galactosyltransferase